MPTVHEICKRLLKEISAIPNPDIDLMDLEEAAYTISEGGENIGDSFRIILCWKLIEYLKSTRLDDKFKL